MKVLISFTIEKELKEQLEEIAKQRGVSLSKLLYDITLEYLIEQVNSEKQKV
ncbi:ribbon-helix-helix domain [Sulfolobales Beppu filamentous virus 3]|uniref:Ribbon-helix-helix domain n=1 Tax=Sulfolobales Beppu filamentous virus 3 TaxID=2493124 RepID=A0A3S8NF05_9VIRU|nr:ribbon-helix-helix domain [Sulfolobales Beppu filamentous virus 3]AZI75846.1 ribbon-helix-helix domain [Sulfolobales Beppu filamentous virus 3]